MSDRLTPLDVSFLYMEESTTAMHVGGVAIFRVPDAGFDYDQFVELISSRIAFVPRYRQRIRTVPGRLANPVWVDDEHFDVTFHVRRSALPRPGTDAQLHELVARLMSRSLDRNRPLWEIYLVEGLSDNRFAVITKTHHAMVDGVSAIDIGQIMLDIDPSPRSTPPDSWHPHPEPSWLELVAGAISDAVRRPTQVFDTLLTGANDLRQTSERVLGAAIGLLSAASVVVQPAPSSPLNVSITSQRRFATAHTDLDDYKRVRKFHGGTVKSEWPVLGRAGADAQLGDDLVDSQLLRFAKVGRGPDRCSDSCPGHRPSSAYVSGRCTPRARGRSPRSRWRWRPTASARASASTPSYPAPLTRRGSAGCWSRLTILMLQRRRCALDSPWVDSSLRQRLRMPSRTLRVRCPLRRRERCSGSMAA